MSAIGSECYDNDNENDYEINQTYENFDFKFSLRNQSIILTPEYEKLINTNDTSQVKIDSFFAILEGIKEISADKYFNLLVYLNPIMNDKNLDIIIYKFNYNSMLRLSNHTTHTYKLILSCSNSGDIIFNVESILNFFNKNCILLMNNFNIFLDLIDLEVKFKNYNNQDKQSIPKKFKFIRKFDLLNFLWIYRSGSECSKFLFELITKNDEKIQYSWRKHCITINQFYKYITSLNINDSQPGFWNINVLNKTQR